MDIQELRTQLKQQIIEELNLKPMTPDEIKDDDVLFGEGLGLDSIDSLELIVLLKMIYGITIHDPKEGRRIFQSISVLADYVVVHRTK
ncbi:phosphopantetheine-binding protein [soil metagenome]